MAIIDRSFYDTSIEVDKLLNKNRPNIIPRYPAETVISQLSDSIQNVLDLLQKQPKTASALLSLCVDSKVDSNKFEKEYIKPLLKQKDGQLNVLAKELKLIRGFFSKEKIITEIYHREVDMIEKPTLEEKQETFSKFMSTLTKFHIEDVNKRINSKYIESDRSVA